MIWMSKHPSNAMKRTFRYFAGLCVLAVLAMGQSPLQNAHPKAEAALRERVGQFYTLFQQGKFRQAEDFVAEDSKETLLHD